MVYQEDDDDKPADPKICLVASALRRLSFPPPPLMSTPLCSLFTLLLLLAFVAATFTCRFSLPLSFHTPNPNASYFPPQQPPLFNSTLLTLSQSNPSDAKKSSPSTKATSTSSPASAPSSFDAAVNDPLTQIINTGILELPQFL